jgi:2-dehydropantoate 2-reductase
MSAHRGCLKFPVIFTDQVSQSYDAILLTCKAYDLEPATESVAAAVGNDTFIVPLLNGLAAYDALDRRFGAQRVLSEFRISPPA